MPIPDPQNEEKTETNDRYKAGPNGSNGSQFPPFVDGPSIKRENIVLPQPIIEGLLSLTEKGELAGGSKSFKTWTLIDQGLSIANGAPWWGAETNKNHVVYLNLELSQPHFEMRLVEVAEARKISIPSTFHVIHLRGYKLHQIGNWASFLQYLNQELHRFPTPHMIADPIYKMLGGKSENSAGDINLMMDQLEDLVQQTQGSNFFGHHYTKGNQSEKEAIDRGSGSGVFQRDPDSLLTMTKHEKDHCYSAGAILRNHPPLKDFVLEWHYPIFTPRGDLDPGDLKKPRGRGPKYSVEQLVEILGDRYMKTSAFEKRARAEIGMTPSTFFVLLKKAEREGFIFKSVESEEWQKTFQSK